MDIEKFKVRMLEDNDISDWFRLRTKLWDELSEDEHKTEMLDIYEHSGYSTGFNGGK